MSNGVCPQNVQPLFLYLTLHRLFSVLYTEAVFMQMRAPSQSLNVLCGFGINALASNCLKKIKSNNNKKKTCD